MSHNQRQRTIQLSLIVFCCLFVAATRTEVPVDCQPVPASLVFGYPRHNTHGTKTSKLPFE